MVANYGTHAEDSGCANSSHFIPLLSLFKGYHHLAHQRSGHSQCLCSLYRMVSQYPSFPCTKRKEIFRVGHSVHVHCEKFKTYQIVQCKSERKSHVATPKATIVTCENTQVVITEKKKKTQKKFHFFLLSSKKPTLASLIWKPEENLKQINFYF